MPIVQITITPQSLEKKAELSKVLTDDLHRITGIPKEAFIIGFYELPGESIATNGELLSEQFNRIGKR